MRLVALVMAAMFVVPIAGATPPCQCSPRGEWSPPDGPVEKVAWGGDSWGPTTTILGETPDELLFVTVFWANDETLVALECASWVSHSEVNVTRDGMLIRDLERVACPSTSYGIWESHPFQGGTSVEPLPGDAGLLYGDAPQCIFVRVTANGQAYGNIPSELPTTPDDCELAKLSCSSCGLFIPAARGPALWALLAAMALLRR